MAQLLPGRLLPDKQGTVGPSPGSCPPQAGPSCRQPPLSHFSLCQPGSPWNLPWSGEGCTGQASQVTHRRGPGNSARVTISLSRWVDRGPSPAHKPCSAGLRAPGLQEQEPQALAGSCRPLRPARSQAGLPGSSACVAVHVPEETVWGRASSGPPSSPLVLGVGAHQAQEPRGTDTSFCGHHTRTAASLRPLPSPTLTPVCWVGRADRGTSPITGCQSSRQAVFF